MTNKVVVGSSVEPAKYQVIVEQLEHMDALLLDTAEWNVPNGDEIVLDRAGAEELWRFLGAWLNPGGVGHADG